MSAPASPPSIQARLLRSLAWWLVAGSVAMGLAVWQVAGHEVDELLDDTLRTAASALAEDVLPLHPPAADGAVRLARGGRHFAWQVVDAEGRLRQRSELAPPEPWPAARRKGFSRVPGWRLHGQALPGGELWLFVAHTQAERREARGEVVLGAVASAVAVALLGYLWLRRRVQQELQPVRALGTQLASFDPGAQAAPTPPFGPAVRQELQPVHDALDGLALRLRQRLATERAFAAHAAHALRTPLAGLDAQLAAAQAEASATPPTQARLLKARQAGARLQGVVAALLGLFRTGSSLQRRPVAVAELLSRLPTPPGLAVQVQEGLQLQADPDLLAAAVLNLLDNAQRHGARTVRVAGLPGGATGLRLHDDGHGLAEDRRQALQAALQAERYEDLPGLGLMLADRVARAHGGQAGLPAVEAGFCVALSLGPVGVAGESSR